MNYDSFLKSKAIRLRKMRSEHQHFLIFWKELFDYAL
jgi:hypothetical protein